MSDLSEFDYIVAFDEFIKSLSKSEEIDFLTTWKKIKKSSLKEKTNWIKNLINTHKRRKGIEKGFIAPSLN